MKFLEKHPMIMIVIGILGISVSAILVKYSAAPSSVTASYRLLWTVVLMTPVVFGKRKYKNELFACSRKTALLCGISGIFLALHFTTWFESLNHTSVASSTTIVCTEVIWVALGFVLFLKGSVSKQAAVGILITITGSVLIAFSDYSAGKNHFYGDILALLAAMFVAVYTLIGRVARTTMTTTVYTFIVYFFCCISLLAFTWGSGISMTGYGLSPIVVGFLLSVFSTLLGHSIFSWCLKYLSPAFVSASKLCEPVAAAVMAGILFQEIPVPMQVLGGAVILAGVLYYSKVESHELK